MFCRGFSVGLAAFTVCATAAAQALPPSLTAAADAQQATPPVTYRSPFEGYRPFQVLPREPWPAVNDRVGALGGQAGALQDETADPAAPPGPARREGGHAGHGR